MLSRISSKGCWLCVALSTPVEGTNPILRSEFPTFVACQVKVNLHFAVHNQSSEQLLYLGYTDCFCRGGIIILKWLIEVLATDFFLFIFFYKCSHPYYCQYSDGYQMNGALYLICTGPLQLNQNQHVFNEFDKTDAM